MDNTNIIRAALDAVAASVQPIVEHSGIPYAIVPGGYELRSLESLLDRPARKQGAIHLKDVDSFIAYVKKHGVEGECVLYAEIEDSTSRFHLVAVLNDHGGFPEAQNWRDFRCHLAPALSVEWLRWKSRDRSSQGQMEFASFLEDNLADISTEGVPSGSDILKMVTEFVVNADKKFRSKLDLQNGLTQFEFSEEEDSGTRSRMQVFNRFTLGLPVFYRSKSAYLLEARLRYRVKDEKKIEFWYELIRPDRVLEAAVGEELDKIRAETGFPVLFGKIDG